MLEQHASPLFKLPAELRLRIYWYVFAGIDLPLPHINPSWRQAREFDGLPQSCKKVHEECQDEKRDAISWFCDIDWVRTCFWNVTTGNLSRFSLNVRRLTIGYQTNGKSGMENLLISQTTRELVKILEYSSQLKNLTIRMSDDAWSSLVTNSEPGWNVWTWFQELGAKNNINVQLESVESCRTW